MESDWVVLNFQTQNPISADARDGILLPRVVNYK
jgi:hypothetical protein